MSARRGHDAGALWENFFFMERVKLHSIRNDFLTCTSGERLTTIRMSSIS